MANPPQSDPRHHTGELEDRFRRGVRHLREDPDEVRHPRARPPLETSAEVPTGLVTAFEHYERGEEAAWR